MADSEKYFTKTVNGQLSVATVAQSGEIIPEETRPGDKYTTALVQTDNGPQLCVKTFEMGEGGGGGGDVPDNVYTQDNLVAGANISITEVAQPLIDENTLHLCHFNDSVADEISGQSDFPNSNLVYLSGKFDKSRGFNSTSFTAVAPQINFNQDTTVDFWLAPLTGAGNVAELSRINASSSSSGAYFLKFYNPGGSTPKIQIGADFSGTGSNVDIQWPNTTFSWGSFFHVVFEKDVTNSVVYLFVNGKKAYEHAHTSSIGNVTLYGRTNGSDTDGTAFDEFRISNVVRWYTDFTPFSVPYSTTAGATQYQINNTQPAPDLSSYLQNTATGTNSLTLLGTATNAEKAINIGNNSQATQKENIAIGNSSKATGSLSFAIGASAEASGYTSTAIGYAKAQGYGSMAINGGNPNMAQATVGNTIQIGGGTNSTAYTLQITSHTLLDLNTGLIPAERIGTGYDATKTQVLKNVNGTLTWVDE